MFLKKLWWGQYPLLRSFWGFYLFGMFCAPFVAAILMLPVYFISRGAGLAVGATLCAIYYVVATVGVWRSADAYGLTRWWPNLAKLLVVLITVRAGWVLVNGGAEHFVQYVTQR